MYQFDSRVRYSETDEQGRLSVTGILNYLQDCSTLQSEDIGLGIEYLKKTRHAWWLSSWQIIIDRYPVLEKRSSSARGLTILREFTPIVILRSRIKPVIIW